MATYYLDYELGSDANDGSAFGAGTAWKTFTNGATAARIAPGDIIKIAKSPAPTSIGNGTWTNNTNVLGGVFPTGLTITGAASNGGPNLIRLAMADTSTLTTNDVVQVLGIVGTVEGNGSWLCTVIDGTHIDLQSSVFTNAWSSGGTCQKINSKAVVLASAQTKNISNCDTAWTGANGGSTTLTAYTSDAKESQACNQLTKITVAANTKYAYKTIPSTDFSGYQKISFWIKPGGVITANSWSLCLCSDTAGASIVDTFIIPAIPVDSKWVAITITKSGGGNLYNAVQSIAWYSGSTPGNDMGDYFDNIIACTTSGLNLSSLISKNSAEQGGAEGWYGIQSIDITGKIILLDNAPATKSNAGRGYSGASGTVPTYIRETTKTTITAGAANSIVDSGTSGNNIQFQGGYDTSTNQQTGETFFDGGNGFGTGLIMTGITYTTCNYLNFYRYIYGINVSTNSIYNTFSNLSNICCNTNGGIVVGAANNLFTSILNCNNNSGAGIGLANNDAITTLTNCNNNLGSGVAFNGHASSIATLTNCNNNAGYGLSFTFANNNIVTVLTKADYDWFGSVNFAYSSSNTITSIGSANYSVNTGVLIDSSSNNNRINSIVTTGNVLGSLGNAAGKNYIRNSTLNESVKIYPTLLVNYANGALYSENQNGVNNHFVYTDNMYITTAAATDGTSWNIYPTNVIRDSYYLFPFVIATIYCEANRQVHVHTTVQKSHATDIACRIICKGGQITGVPNDVIATKASDTNEEVLTLKFTPTASGSVEILFQGWWVANAADEHVTLRTLVTNARKYGKVYLQDTQTTQAFDYILKYSTDSANSYITQATQGTVDAYSGIAINHATQTMTLTADHTLHEIYDYTQSNLTADANLVYPEWFTTTDGVNYTSTYNIVNGNNITGGGTINVGALTFTQNGTYDGIIITSTNRSVHAIESGLVASSSVSIYDTTNSTSLFNNVVAGTSKDLLYTWASDINISIDVKKYTYVPINFTSSITNIGQARTFSQSTDSHILVSNPATVGAYGEFTINHATQTVTISADTTLRRLYDYAQWDLVQTANMRKSQWLTTTNDTDYVSTYNIVLNTGVDLTGGGSVNVGVMTFTKTGTATYDGIIITSTNRSVHLSLAGLVAGSTVQVYDNTSASELYNAVVAGTSLNYIFTYTVDHSMRIRVRKAGYIPYEYTGNIVNTGLALNASQTVDSVYVANGIDGSTVTEYSLSGGTIKIYVDDPDNSTSGQRLYNWYMYALATTTYIGIQPNDITAQTAWSYVLADAIQLYNQDLVNPLFIQGANINNVSGDGQVIDNAGGMININGYFPFSSAGDVGNSVWDTQESAITTSGSIGKKLKNGANASIASQ